MTPQRPTRTRSLRTPTLMTRPEHPIDRERGASPAGVIILIGTLLMVADLILMGGRMASAHAEVAGAAQEAARRGSLAQTAGSVYPVAATTALDNVTRNAKHCSSTTVSTAGTEFRAGGHVTVTVTCTVQLSDLASLPIPGAIVVRADATEIVETYRAVD